MKRIKPITLAVLASISFLFTVTAFAQPAQPEAPATIDAGSAALPDAMPAASTEEAPAATAPDESKQPDAPEAAPDAAPAEEPANPAAENPTGFAKDLWAKYKSREWLPLVGGVLLFLVFLFRKFASKISDFFDTKKGGYVVSLSTAFGLTFGLALWAGSSISFDLLAIAFGTAIAASGGYDMLRDFLGSVFASKDEDLIGEGEKEKAE